jgi:hypothetical protein
MTALKATRGLALAAGLAMGLLLSTASGAFAASPPRIDPFVQQATLTASDEIGKSLLGSAVSLSHDGNTALIGGPADNGRVGAAWVFVRRGSIWTQQAKLTGGGELGSANFGTHVALSSHGNTALIGGPADNGGVGAAWVFVRRGSIWTQQAKLTGSRENVGTGEDTNCDGSPRCYRAQGRFAESVALASDGKIALIGGPGDNENEGAAWVFTRSGSTWTQQGEKLTGGGEQNFNGRFPFTEHIGGQFGNGVALSRDGSTALIAGVRDRSADFEGDILSGGAAWVFTRSGSMWTQQGEKLSRCGEGFSFGESVALSGDGNTALIGAPRPSFDDLGIAGSVCAFTRLGSTWTQQGEPLQRSEPEVNEQFGLSVALSADGNSALIGRPKASEDPIARHSYPAGAWQFTRSGSTLTQQFPPLTCGGEACSELGFAPPFVALSGDAKTALVGTTVFVNSPPHK